MRFRLSITLLAITLLITSCGAALRILDIYVPLRSWTGRVEIPPASAEQDDHGQVDDQGTAITDPEPTPASGALVMITAIAVPGEEYDGEEPEGDNSVVAGTKGPGGLDAKVFTGVTDANGTFHITFGWHSDREYSITVYHYLASEECEYYSYQPMGKLELENQVSIISLEPRMHKEEEPAGTRDPASGGGAGS